MPRSGWGVFFAIVFGLAAAQFLSWAASYSYREFYQPAEQNYPAERYQPARDTSYPVPTKQHSPTEAYDPHCDQPQNKDDADLCAQWGAVRAVNETNRLTRAALKLGFIGFWVAALGGLLGAIGTAFLIMTFRENRRSADAAHDANRPWLQLEIIDFGDFRFNPIGASIEIKVCIHNRGDSPATNVLLITQMVPAPTTWFGTPVQTGVARFKRIFALTSDKTGGIMVFPNTTPTETLVAKASMTEINSAETAGEAIYELVLGVRYQFAGRVGQTVYSFAVTDTASPKRAIYFKNDIPAGRVRLIDTHTGYAA